MPRQPADPDSLLQPVALEFATALENFGATPQGVLWRNHEGQRLRFQKLLGILGADDSLAGDRVIADLGCGYGALWDMLIAHPAIRTGRYFGYDISEPMLAAARRRVADPRTRFVLGHRLAEPVDYTLVSGTYNLKMDVPNDLWLGLVHASLRDAAAMSRRGLAFNMLAPDRTRPPQRTLYYAHPHAFVEFCREAFGPRVTLVRDYPLAEWTIWVRLD